MTRKYEKVNGVICFWCTVCEAWHPKAELKISKEWHKAIDKEPYQARI